MKLNTSYELVITALNSEAKLKARFHLTEDSTLETFCGMDTTRMHVKEEDETTELKVETSNSNEEFSPVSKCEVVLSVDVGSNYESKEEASPAMAAASCSVQGHDAILNETKTAKTEELGDCNDTSKGMNVIDSKEVIENNQEGSDIDHSMPLDVPSLTIYGPAMCDLCNVTFTDMDEFDNHVVSQHLQKHKWQCVRCDDNFEQSQDLVLHKATVHGEEPVCCERCWEKKETDENSCDERIEEEWLEEPEAHLDESQIHANNVMKENGHLLEFYCELCDRNFNNETKLKDHYLIHVPRSLVCIRCGLKCNSFYELSVHKKSHVRNTKDKRYTCEVCRKTFLERILFNYHRRHCGNKQYTCNFCDRTFLREYSYQLHMKVHKQEQKEYKCDCGQKFDNFNSLQVHKKTHERQTTMKCVTCQKVFTNETLYKRHRYIHDPEFWDRFKCQTCQRPFRDAHALKDHMQLHAGIKPHMCDLCGRTYNRFANMLKHRKLHKPQNLWEHKCNHCEAKFERLKDLMSHIEHAHSVGDTVAEDISGKKPMKWICRFCGKRISTKLSLQDHERIHTGAKPYICEWCGREFRSRPNLLQHHLTHTGDRKHACGVCGKRFARKSFIAQHMRVHTGEKPFECDLCGKRFTQAGDMKRHRNRHVQQQKEQYALLVQIPQ
ncbi:oocyte zinc finger protein XlCOF6-like isoform X2 [Periplaneta americana]